MQVRWIRFGPLLITGSPFVMASTALHFARFTILSFPVEFKVSERSAGKPIDVEIDELKLGPDSFA